MPRSLSEFANQLRRLPRVVGIKVAEEAAPVITALANSTFDESADAYGRPWKPGKKGQRVTLRKSGDLARFIRYVAVGTRLRVALGVPYAKWQVGKRPIFPRQGSELPDTYVRALQRTAVDVVRRELGK